ncbi:MAG: heme-binding protein [Planctomycetes bacterium]|nr:heme-binding protein [Planctomycetota bacterium]
MHTDSRRTPLEVEALEERAVPATAALAAGTLTVTGTPDNDRVRVFTDGTTVRVLDGTQEIGAFAAGGVTAIDVNGGAGNDTILIDPNLFQQATINGATGDNKLVAGGGLSTLLAGGGRDVLFGSNSPNTFNADGGVNDLYRVKPGDVVFPNAGDRLLPAFPPGTVVAAPQATITAAEVDILLRRAAAASASSDAIIAITDRNGRILGVRVESGVAAEVTGNINTFVFAVDGAVAKARTGAFFGNNQAPLTSRTIQFISQSTITEREVNSNPNITDPNSTLRGPGFVAAVGTKGHFPPDIAFTPQVDLFQIEHTNRDGTFHVGNDRVKGTADDVQLLQRFNINPAFVPVGQGLFPPDSFGFETGLLPGAQSRGIATLPGGIPIYKNGEVVGGIGVFFPGRTGFATEENSRLSTTFNPALPDRSQEAEWIAFAALGGTRAAVGNVTTTPVGDLGGVALPAGFGLPAGRIDLVGIQLDVFGPGGSVEGARALVATGNAVGRGSPNDGANVLVDGGANGVPGGGDDIFLLDGVAAPDGWLVMPHDGVGISAAEVNAIITEALVQADKTRAAIRLPVGTRAKFVYAVADREGNIVGLFRQKDATIFSIDVAVAKARNVAYYADPAQLQAIDQLPNVAPGFAFTNRTFRFLGEPRFPLGIDIEPPGPFSQLHDDPLGTNRFNGRLEGAALPASAYDSVVGYDSFNPGTNFHQQGNVLNQNGIVFFPGSSPLYRPVGGGFGLIGGFGVSGDGVDQDDVVTVAGQSGFGAPLALRADQIIFAGVRLPYQKFNRNPEG